MIQLLNPFQVELDYLTYLKGGTQHALDDFCDSCDLVASGFDQRLHDWRFHPYPPGDRHCGGSDPCHPGAKTIIGI